MNRKRILMWLAVACLCLTQGCASIISKSSYPVNITSRPSGAQYRVSDRTGKLVSEGKTPAVVTLKAGAGYFQPQRYTVALDLPGHGTREVPIEVGLDGWYLFGNFFFGGLIGYLVVDPLTGAMWELKDVHVNMDSVAASQLSQPSELRVVTLDQVPVNLRTSMVRIE